MAACGIRTQVHNDGFGDITTREARERLDLHAQNTGHVAPEEETALVHAHQAFEEPGRRPGHSIHDLPVARDSVHPSSRGRLPACELPAAQIAHMRRPRPQPTA